MAKSHGLKARAAHRTHPVALAEANASWYKGFRLCLIVADETIEIPQHRGEEAFDETCGPGRPASLVHCMCHQSPVSFTGPRACAPAHLPLVSAPVLLLSHRQYEIPCQKGSHWVEPRRKIGGWSVSRLFQISIVT